MSHQAYFETTLDEEDWVWYGWEKKKEKKE